MGLLRFILQPETERETHETGVIHQVQYVLNEELEQKSLEQKMGVVDLTLSTGFNPKMSKLKTDLAEVRYLLADCSACLHELSMLLLYLSTAEAEG